MDFEKALGDFVFLCVMTTFAVAIIWGLEATWKPKSAQEAPVEAQESVGDQCAQRAAQTPDRLIITVECLRGH